MNTTTLIIIGMAEIFLIACLWIGTWRDVARFKTLIASLSKGELYEQVYEATKNVRKRD